MITIKLPHDHFHAGKRHFAGEEFTFTEEEFDWFLLATRSNRENHIAAMQAKVGTPEWAAKTIADAEAVERGELQAHRDIDDADSDEEDGE